MHDFDFDWDDEHDHEHEIPLALKSSVPHNGQTGVSPNLKAIKLVFNRGFDHGRFSACNDLVIELWQGSDMVPIRIKPELNPCKGVNTVLVIPVNPLKGGKVYKLRITMFSNHDATKSIKLIVFTTACRS